MNTQTTIIEAPQRKDRRGFIGSSEVGAVMGLDPFKTPLRLFTEKAGIIEPDDLSDNEAVEWGQRLERVVSQKFSEKHGVKLIAYKKRFVHPDYPYMSCELDNIIAGTEEMVEIKTASAYTIKKWERDDQIPAHYICQVMFALGLSKRRVGHIAVLVGGQRYIEKKILFDQELFDNLVERVREFWKMVQDNTPPMASGDDRETLLELFPFNTSAEMIQGLEELNVAIARRQELSGQIDAMLDEKAEIENKLRQIIGVNAGLITSKYIITNKEQKTAPKMKTEQMKADGVYEKYTEENKTRVLRISLKKEVATADDNHTKRIRND